MQSKKIIWYVVVVVVFLIGLGVILNLYTDTQEIANVEVELTESQQMKQLTASEIEVQEDVVEHRTVKTVDEFVDNPFQLQFTIPVGWEVEYVPSIESLNLYTLSGDGTARDRSQIFIRYFDANQFLTLSTVTIHSTMDRTVGQREYIAKQYEIEKNPGIPDFIEQPIWRNQRHYVTDFRKTDGYVRYYVVAANPDTDTTIVEDVLESMVILDEL